jgi:GNAT superfamily N-acetyltransferase
MRGRENIINHKSVEVNIRVAIRSDMAAILGLVNELAVYEKEPDAVIARLAEYEAAYDEGLIHCKVAEYDDAIVGMTLSYMTFSTWKGKCIYLEDFYVQPQYRSFGIGKRLFDQFIEDAKAAGVKQVKWQVLDWNEPAIQFYERNHAVIEKNWWNCKMYFLD